MDHLSFSSNGGAGLVASLLVKGQVALGINAELQTVTDSSLWDDPWSHPALTIRSAIDKFVVSSAPEAPMFSLARRGARSRTYKPRSGAILHLHWTEGVYQRKRILEWLADGHNVVFTLHDMSPFTGGCHQSLGCRGFEASCKSCPQIRPIFRSAVESRFVKLPDLWEFRDQIAVVAPSLWMRDQAIKSRHFSELKVTVIENPIDPTFFQNFDRKQIRRKLQIPEGAFVACSIATQVNNPAKRVKDCLKVFSEACAGAGVAGCFILVGDGSQELARVYPFAISVGSGGPDHVARALAATDVLVSGSLAESAGMSIREASAQGVPAVVISNGGSDNMVSDSQAGHLVRDFKEMKSVLTNLMITGHGPVNLELRQKMRRVAATRAGLEIISKKYADVYGALGSNRVAGQ